MQNECNGQFLPSFILNAVRIEAVALWKPDVYYANPGTYTDVDCVACPDAMVHQPSKR